MRTVARRLLLFASLATSVLPASARADDAGEVAAVARVLDDFHKAAAEADEARYFAHFAPEGVFVGTDPTERWTVDSFRTFAHPFFARGKAWTYVPSDRHVVVTGTSATFDEALHNDKYGLCRGTGALRKIDGAWKIVQYSLSFPVPNGLALKVIAILRGDDPAPAKAQ